MYLNGDRPTRSRNPYSSERACRCAWLAQLGERHGFREVFVDEAPHALHRHTAPRQCRSLAIGTLRIRHIAATRHQARRALHERAANRTRRHSTRPARRADLRTNPNPRDRRCAYTSAACADARAIPRRPRKRDEVDAPDRVREQLETAAGRQQHRIASEQPAAFEVHGAGFRRRQQHDAPASAGVVPGAAQRDPR